ncbi:MAG TPA: bifunctional nicotinamidase/pyrazinamidase [Sphingobacteriaceae bacterium]
MERFHYMKTLIIVDVQNDFLPGGALAVPLGDQVIPVINRIQDHFGLVVATQDWHPVRHGSFASSHPGKQPFDKTDLFGLEQVLWPDHCIQATPGADLSTLLHSRRIEAIFRKGTDPAIDSYSGFYDNGHQKSTGLAGYLRDKGTTELFISGLAGDYCVYYTARDAIQEGFQVTILEDACRPIDAENYQLLKQDIHQLGGMVQGSDTL